MQLGMTQGSMNHGLGKMASCMPQIASRCQGSQGVARHACLRCLIHVLVNALYAAMDRELLSKLL